MLPEWRLAGLTSQAKRTSAFASQPQLFKSAHSWRDDRSTERPVSDLQTPFHPDLPLLLLKQRPGSASLDVEHSNSQSP